ncbi:hypothetical protein PYCCODRAFT_1450640 [Trametes coccinea BRFM310]|uniref:Uncharacterized protein n=1 Tax=Trametes coccinea (strain BRFM310) TaxID=1353009 RepID=A0A1Y2IVD3_TRAC3|nr:hypothetical protein PYCCODRAFT_1450640 [Trametes coccinea BRFM310]
MYTHSPSSTGSTWSVLSDTPSTPSHAPRSVVNAGLPSTPRTPNTPLTPISPGSPGYCPPYAGSHYGSSNHSVSYGLMTPPASPDKIARGQTDFHPILDARAQPCTFDVRVGFPLNPQIMSAPAINHPVRRIVVRVAGMFTIEVVSRAVPTVGDFFNQIADGMKYSDPRNPRATKGSLLGPTALFAGLTLRSLDPSGVAFCDMHIRNGA